MDELADRGFLFPPPSIKSEITAPPSLRSEDSGVMWMKRSSFKRQVRLAPAKTTAGGIKNMLKEIKNIYKKKNASGGKLIQLRVAGRQVG